MNPGQVHMYIHRDIDYHNACNYRIAYKRNEIHKCTLGLKVTATALAKLKSVQNYHLFNLIYNQRK
jgi:hypothetical protein